jgi:outer membrane protein assembly factor BamB
VQAFGELNMNAQGFLLNCQDFDGDGIWKARARGAGITDGTQVFSPPSVGKERLYLCTAMGHLLDVDKETGKPGFLYATKRPMVYQPALAEGNVYAPTAGGLLICLKTGSDDADGWYAWGGNAQHNKTD